MDHQRIIAQTKRRARRQALFARRYVFRQRRAWKSLPKHAKSLVYFSFCAGLAAKVMFDYGGSVAQFVHAWWKLPPEVRGIPVVAEEIFPDEIEDLFSTYTVLLPSREAILRAPSQVVISSVLARVGDTVHEGQTLVRFQSEAQSLKSSLDNIELSRKEMDIELTLALSKKNYVSGRELKQTQLDHKANEVRRKLANLDSGSTLRSPIGGVLAELTVVPGDFIDQAQGYAARVIDPMGGRLELFVPNTVATRLKLGGAAKVKLVEPTETENESVEATVVNLSSTIDPKTGSVFVGVSLKEKPESWRSGALVEAALVLARSEAALLVSRRSLILKDGKSFVYRVKPDGTGRAPASDEKAKLNTGEAELVPVRLGISSDERVEIVEGIEPGDLVVSKGQSALSAGAAVELTKE